LFDMIVVCRVCFVVQTPVKFEAGVLKPR
jgi:hypothetical protein